MYAAVCGVEAKRTSASVSEAVISFPISSVKAAGGRGSELILSEAETAEDRQATARGGAFIDQIALCVKQDFQRQDISESIGDGKVKLVFEELPDA